MSLKLHIQSSIFTVVWHFFRLCHIIEGEAPDCIGCLTEVSLITTKMGAWSEITFLWIGCSSGGNKEFMQNKLSGLNIESCSCE